MRNNCHSHRKMQVNNIHHPLKTVVPLKNKQGGSNEKIDQGFYIAFVLKHKVYLGGQANNCCQN